MSQDRIDKLEDMLYKTSQQQNELVIEIRGLIARLDTKSEDIDELKEEVKLLQARSHLMELELAKLTSVQESNRTYKNLMIGAIFTFIATIAAMAWGTSSSGAAAVVGG